MEIIDLNETENSLKLVVNSNEETFFTLLKVYLQELKDVEIVGVSKPHHLVDETELHIKANSKKDIKSIVKEALVDVKSSLEDLKL